VGIYASDFAIEEWTNLFGVAWGKQSRRNMGSEEEKSEEKQEQEHLCFQAGGRLK
jgi:hypothetical protein